MSVTSGTLEALRVRPREALTAITRRNSWALGLVAFFAVLHDYQRRRVTTFLDPESDPLGAGYHITQSKIAIGSGGILGKGFGNGSQSHLEYLPEAHTDFVFAVLAEELGLVGSTLVIGLFAVLVYRAFVIGRRALAAGLPFHGILSTGIGITLGIQAGINIGVNTGLLPTKGLTLPLISYGRTSTVITLCAIGLLLRICTELSRAEMLSQRTGRSGKRRSTTQ